MKEFYLKHKQTILIVAIIVAVVLIWKYKDQIKAKVTPKKVAKKPTPLNGGGQEIVTVSNDNYSAEENSDPQPGIAIAQEEQKETVYVN